jgi:hypothetical protein
MSKETAFTQGPAIFRLKSFLFGISGLGLDDKELETHRVFEDGSVDVEYFRASEPVEREYLRCEIKKNGKFVFGFALGEHGLESVGFGKLKASFAGAEELNVEPALSIGVRGDLNYLHVADEEVPDFQRWANEIVDWTIDAVKNYKIGEIPFKIASA